MRAWLWPGLLFVVATAAQLFLIAGVGTDIPYQDQWGAEGRQIYPRWVDHTWRAADLFEPHNEHRIVWTRALDLGLFVANGRWDPLVQLVVNAGLRAAVAALLCGLLARGNSPAAERWMVAGLVVAFLPHLAWQNVLWGFQSEVYFVLLFSIAAFALLRPEHSSLRRKLAGLAAGGGAMLAMGPGLLVPAALLGLTVIRGVEQRENLWHGVRRNWPALLLLLAAAGLHRDVAAHAALHPRAPAQFFAALGRAAAWPHVWTPLAALAVNLPVLWLMIARLARRRRAVHNEDFVTLLSVWALALVVAMAWTRGGSDEFDGGVPSRYADFLILLTIGNVWSLITLLREAPPSRIRLARAAAWGWIAFLFLGWLALSSEIMTRLVLPRWRDPDGPVRAAVAFQRTHDFSVFVGQPLLYLPDPNRETLIAVLDDPRMQGRLPPSLQPAENLGPWSNAVRRLLGRSVLKRP